jgi:hypothetical protein
MPRAGLAGGDAQNNDDIRIPKEDGYITIVAQHDFFPASTSGHRAAVMQGQVRCKVH